MSPEQAARWPRWARFLVGVFAVIGFAYAAVLMVFWSGAGCFVQESAIVPSPSDAFTARVTVRTCRNGAPATEIWVSRNGSDSVTTTSQSIFIATARIAESGGYETIPVHVAWQSDDELQVSYPYAMPFNSRVELVDGVRVSYREVSPRSP